MSDNRFADPLCPHGYDLQFVICHRCADPAFDAAKQPASTVLRAELPSSNPKLLSLRQHIRLDYTTDAREEIAWAVDEIERLDADLCLLTCERDMFKRQRADWKAVADSRAHVPPGEPPYRVRSFWSPCRKYLVTAYVSAGDITLMDDDSSIWEPTGQEQDVTHHEHCDVNDQIIKGKPCNCKIATGAAVTKSVIRDDVKCECVGNFGPNPDCGMCGGDGCITVETDEKQRTRSLSNTAHRPCNQSLGSPAGEAVVDDPAGRFSHETGGSHGEG